MPPFESVSEILLFKLILRHNIRGIGMQSRLQNKMFQEIEKKAIMDVLNEMGGDKTKTAKKLGIGLRTLYRKIEKWGLDA